MNIADIRKSIEARRSTSAWDKGVQEYALEPMDELDEAVNGGRFDMADFFKPRALRATLLNGASDWKQYSWGGCSLIYDGDIAERLCTPSELKKKRGGELRPNSREEWLDVQARALFQAANLIFRMGTFCADCEELELPTC